MSVSHVRVFSLLVVSCDAHASLMTPPARTEGHVPDGDHDHYNFNHGNPGLLWFSQAAFIPGSPTNNDPATRTVRGDEGTAMNPWRAPGSAPVLGSGCGVAGGANVPMPNGGEAPVDYPQYPLGMDGKDLPEKKPTVWQIGSTQEVSFAFFANHGGGYQYRLCRKGNISEECFQKNPLKFNGKHSWIQYADLAKGKGRKVIDRLLAHPDDVIPKKSQWARNPIPMCFECNQDACGSARPNLTERISECGFTRAILQNETYPCTTGKLHHPPVYGGDVWYRQDTCRQKCAMAGGTVLGLCDKVQFPSPVDNLSGFANLGNFSIVDKVEIPSTLEPGEYLMSWRWDAEQSSQIWQNCADISLRLAEIQV